MKERNQTRLLFRERLLTACVFELLRRLLFSSLVLVYECSFCCCNCVSFCSLTNFREIALAANGENVPRSVSILCLHVKFEVMVMGV